MRKFSKILILVITILFIFSLITRIYASSVNMNLSNDNSTYGSNQSSNTSQNTSGSSVTVSNTVSQAQEGLSISDMINIILCAIGIVLVLLGIAILIRQKS